MMGSLETKETKSKRRSKSIIYEYRVRRRRRYTAKIEGRNDRNEGGIIICK
jgi:hypothetical protein